MTEHAAKELCINLMKADSEEDVIALLKEAGYWDRREMWRLYGDKEGNFAQVGNQQSLPEAALVEKIINSVDARLMRECLLRKIEPESEAAPKSVRDAVAMFYEDRRSGDDEAGTLVNWPTLKRKDESAAITLSATGDRPTRGRKSKNMCLTVVDLGEGQTPSRLPHTILSLNAKNKQAIRFVQGKFNMGGSGSLRFCYGGLQLVISRRCVNLLNNGDSVDASDNMWGFTVVRREEPSNKSGDPIHSEFTYLAPLNADNSPRKGEVLRFSAATLPLMPEHDEPYVRQVEWGTLIKLYEYETSIGQSNILMPDGLLYALERLIPGIALPLRLHECRGYKGEKERSFETTLAGLTVRLEEGKGGNLEPGFPISSSIRAANMTMKARIYAFKEDRASTYLKDEGVIFVIQGQAHGNLPKSVFSRPKAVGLPRLKDSLLVLVDCSSLSAVQREDLFMSSRDRLSKKPIRYQVEQEIEELLRNSPELKRLQNERREKDTQAKLSEEKPFEEILKKVFKASPTLKTLFLMGRRLPRPFPRGTGTDKNGEKGPNGEENIFKGLRHPTYFRIVNHEYGKEYKRTCEMGRRCHVKFETDVENGYFDRSTDQGTFDLEIIESSLSLSSPSFSVILEDGFAYLNMALPHEVREGCSFTVQVTVKDPTLLKPFVNTIRLCVNQMVDRKGGRKREPNKRTGGGSGQEPSREGISLPEIIPVHESDVHWMKYKFAEETACHVISEPIDEDGKQRLVHTFYVNVDNISLKTEMKYSKQDARLLEAKFKYANVLLGVAMLHDEYGNNGEPNSSEKNESSEKNDSETVEDKIRKVTQAVAPVLLPVIDQLSGLNEDELDILSQLGEDD